MYEYMELTGGKRVAVMIWEDVSAPRGAVVIGARNVRIRRAIRRFLQVSQPQRLLRNRHG